MNISGKIAWVTGASSGIGRALALALAREGARLILSGRRADALATVAAEISGDCLILPFEATDTLALPTIVAQAHNWHGRIDILVNNAGISQRSLAVETDARVYEQVIATDLLAPIYLTQACLPYLTANNVGLVVAISSVAGRIGVPLRTAYCAAKHGLIGYMDALRAETEVAHGLHVLSVLPGSVATDVARNALTAQGERRGLSDPQIDNGIPADECADAIVAAIHADARELIVARGMEMEMARLRQADGDALFAMTAKFGAQIAGAQ
ncbi:MAG: SDR family NAD(P)-dependent oxidoreductase [Sphingopyxis sp.]